MFLIWVDDARRRAKLLFTRKAERRLRYTPFPLHPHPTSRKAKFFHKVFQNFLITFPYREQSVFIYPHLHPISRKAKFLFLCILSFTQKKAAFSKTENGLFFLDDVL